MDIEISYKKLKKIIGDSNKLKEKYGSNCAKKIIQRYNELESAPNLEMIIKYKIGRCHLLKGNLKGKYALDLEHPLRMIIEPIFENENQDLKNITSVRIIKVEDYHG